MHMCVTKIVSVCSCMVTGISASLPCEVCYDLVCLWMSQRRGVFQSQFMCTFSHSQFRVLDDLQLGYEQVCVFVMNKHLLEDEIVYECNNGYHRNCKK